MPFGEFTPQQVLQQAARMMPSFDLIVEQASSIYETPPFPDARQPNFANAVIKVKTKHDAENVLRACFGIERRFNRERDERWGARTLDIDLLAYNEIVLPSLEVWYEIAQADDVMVTDLILPHPRLHKRRFVLEPLMEIAPHWVHPILGNALGSLCKQIKAAADVDDIKRLSLKLL